MKRVAAKLMLVLIGAWCLACTPLAAAEAPEIEALRVEPVCMHLEESSQDEVKTLPAIEPEADHSTAHAHRDQLPASIYHGLRSFMGCGAPLIC